MLFAAPAELRVRTLFEQGFGIVGGYIGSAFGAQAIGFGIVTILGLGPLGLFLTVFVCAAAGAIAGTALGRKLGGDIYYFGNQAGRGKRFFSIDDILDVAK